jgi:hypothetical protein
LTKQVRIGVEGDYGDVVSVLFLELQQGCLEEVGGEIQEVVETEREKVRLCSQLARDTGKVVDILPGLLCGAWPAAFTCSFEPE